MSDLIDQFHKMAEACNRDSGYPNSYGAAIEYGDLRQRWLSERPDTEVPWIFFCNEAGRYIVRDLPPV